MFFVFLILHFSYKGAQSIVTLWLGSNFAVW
jgi:hypothetical protein